MTSVRSIGAALPALEVTNSDLDREHPAWRMGLVAELTGIESRRIAAAGETAFDLSVEACERLFEQDGLDAADVDAILYCTHDPDYPMPGNAQLLHRRLGLGDAVLAFDYRLACSGFVYGLALADALARAASASGLLLVTAETTSKHTDPADRATRALFGDGAAATFLSAEDGLGGGRILACEMCTHGLGFEHGYIPAGGARSPEGDEAASGDLRMDGTELWGLVGAVVPGHIRAFLEKSSLGLDDIDLCVFHQASKLVLDTIAKALGLPQEKLFLHMREVGNLSSASIPVALRAALDQGAIRPGDTVLLSGFGVGVSYGSAILQF